MPLIIALIKFIGPVNEFGIVILRVHHIVGE